jgi:hypothetical protein
MAALFGTMCFSAEIPLWFALFGLVAFGAWAALTITRYFKQKRLLMWGQAAHADIFEAYPAYPSGGIPCTYLRYRFQDNDGNTINGTSGRIPSIAARPFQPDVSTVLFNPKNTDHHALYPLDYVKWQLPAKSREP